MRVVYEHDDVAFAVTTARNADDDCVSVQLNSQVGFRRGAGAKRANFVDELACSF